MNATALIRLTGVGLRLTLATALVQGVMSCSGSLKDNEDLVGLQEEVPEVIEGAGGEKGTGPLGAESLVFTPATHDFGPVSSAAEAVVVQLTLKNLSKDPAFIANVEAEADDHYELRTHDCPVAPLPLNSAATCSMTVAFKPADAGNLNYRVTVPFGPNPGQTDFSAFASLTGRGVLPIEFDGLLAIDPATISTTKMTLTWKAAEGAASYAVYDKASKKSEPLALVTGESTTFTVTNLTPAKKYTFAVHASNELGEEENNDVERSAKTDQIGAFEPLANIIVAEGDTKEGVDLGDFCTDSEGNQPTFMALNDQSDTDANCTIARAPFRVVCSPGYKTGHAAWTAELTLSCLLNDYPSAFTRTVTVDVADTNRAPVIDSIANRDVLAGTTLPTVDANGADDKDADEDVLTYACRFDTAVDNTVSDAAPACTTLLNQDGSTATFDPATGAFDWTPRLADANDSFELKITASDGTLTDTDVFTVDVGQPPPSPVHSTIAISSPSISSGSTATITLTARDSAGNNLLAGGAVVVFSHAGGTSTGTISATTDQGNGTYTAIITGKLAGTSTNINAKVAGSNVTSGSPALQVTPGPISATKSVISVASTTVPSGSAVQLTLTGKDAAGNVVPAGGATVVFNRSGGTSTGTIGATTDNGNGSYSASFTGVVAGTPTTVGATIGGTAVTTTLPTVKVNPGPPSLATSVVTITGNPATVASGNNVIVTLRAKDAAGNNLSSGGLGVSFNISGGSSTGSFGGVTDNGDGTYAAAFTGQAAGTAVTLGATVGGSAVTSAMPSIVVIPGAVSLTASTVTVANGLIASGGSTALTLTIRDTFGNQHTAGGRTVVFLHTGGVSTGTISGTTDNGNGTYSATFTGVLAGSPTSIGATINGSPVIAAAPTIQVVPGAVSTATSLVSLSATTVGSGASINLTLTAKDANGNALTAGGATVLFNRSGGTSTGTISGTTDNANGSYSATFTGIVAGTATTVGATINGTTVTSVLPAVAVIPGPISLSDSVISVGSGSVTSGLTTTIMLRAKDVNGNNLTTGGRTVLFSHTGGTSTGSFSAVADNSDGTYTAVFTGLVSGTATSINATADGSSVTTAAPTVSVIPGAISASTSLVTLGAASIASGATTTATLQAKDINGNNLTAGGSTVTFNISNGTSTATFGATTDNGNGTYTATATGVVSGTATNVGANIGAAPVTTVKPTLTVIPGPYSLSQSVITVTGATVVSGSSRTATLRLKDAVGNNVSAGGETVTFSHSGGTSTGTFGSVTDNLDGSYSVTFTGIVAGLATDIDADVNASPVMSASPTITVLPGALSLADSLITVSSGTIASGSTSTLTLTAKDANGNSRSTGGDVVVFARTGGTSTGTITGTTDNNNGSYTATFTGVLAGTATNITATVGGAPVTSGNPTITVQHGPISITGSTVTASSSTVNSGSNVTLTLTAKDAAGNLIGNGGGTIVFSHAGGTSTGTISATTDVLDGTYTATFAGVLAGTPTTIGATIGGTPVTSTMPTVKVNPGAYSLANSAVTIAGNPATLASGASVAVTLQAKDTVGNNLTSGGLSVSFALAGGTSTGSFSAVTDNTNGTYTASFTAQAAGTAVAFNATIGGAPVTSAAPSLVVVPGAISLTASTVTVGSGSVGSGSSTGITLTVRDTYGNQHTSGGQTVVFSLSGGTSGGTFSAVTDVGNGTYTATFTGVAAGTATNVRATYNGFSIASAAPTVQVVPGPVSIATSLLTVSAGTVASGASVTLTLTAKDGNGNALAAGGETIVFSRSGGTSTGTISATTDNLNGTYTATFTGVVSGSATTAGASINGSAITSTLPTVTVVPGAISLANSLITVGSPTVTSGLTTSVSLQAKDVNNNNLTNGGLTVLFSRTGGTSTGTFGATTDNSDGTYSATFTGAIAGTATTINATVGGSAVTSVSPTISVIPGAISPAASVVTVGTGSIASGATTTVTLQAKDGAGNNLSAGGSTVTFNMSGGLSTVSFGSVTDNGNGTYSAVATGVVSGTATNIGANIGAAPVTTAKPTLTVVPGPYSLSQSLVTVTAATVISGSSRTVTLRLKDAAGNNVTAGGETVAFSYSGGSSTGTFGSVTDNTDGSYSAAFTGIVAGLATTLHADVNTTPVTSAGPTITVLPGALSLAQSLISVSSGTVSSGSSLTLTLTAKDSNGNGLTLGGETVVFARSGGTSTGAVSATTDNNNGTYTATFTAAIAGTATNITATVGGSAVTSGNPTVTVQHGPISIAGSTVTVSSGSVTSGNNVTMTLTAKDAAGNLISNGGALIAFGNSGGTSTGTIGSVTDNLDGTYSAVFGALVAGSPTTVSATIGGTPVSTTMPTITVNPGPYTLANSIVSVLTSPSTVASGASVTLRLQAKDVNNNNLTSGGLTVAFNFSGGTSTGTIGAVTDNNNGTYTATFTAAAAGTAINIDGLIGGSPVTSTLPSFSVVPGAYSLVNSVVTVSSGTVTSGATRTVTLTTKDTFGNNLTAGGLTVAFSHATGSSTGTFSSLSDVGNGTYTATFTGVAAGSATEIHATINGFTVTSAAPTMLVTPGAISTATSTITVSSATVPSGTTSTLTLTSRDANGNVIPTGTETVVFNRSGGTSTGSISATTDNGNGTYAATFSGVTAGTATTISATINGTAVTSTLPTIAVVPGAVSLANSLLSVSLGTVASGSPVTLTLTAKDVNDNFLTSGGRTVVFSHAGGSSTGTITAATDNSNGIYTATFTGVAAGTATSISASVDGSAVTSASPTISVIPSTISTAASVVTVSAGTVGSSSTVTVTLTAKDANGNNLTTGGSTVLFNHTGGGSTGTFGSVTDNSNGTYTATFTGVLAGSATNIGATIGGAPVTTVKPTVSVTPGAISVAQSTITRSSGSVASGGSVNLTLTAKDGAGNSLTAGGETVVFSHAGGVSTGNVGTTTDNGNGTYTATFTGIVAGTATSINATINGSPVTSPSPTVTVVPGALSLAQSTIGASAGSVISGSNITVTLTAKDANGNQLTSGGATVAFGKSGGTSTGTFGSTADGSNGLYTATFTGVLAGTATDITATVGGSAVTSASPSVTVTVGTISASASLITVSSATIASGATSTVTLTGKDAAGNLIPSGGATIAFNRSGGTSSGGFTGLTDNGDGTYVATFTGTTAGSATTIGATINAVPVTSSLPSITVVPGANSEATSTISVSSATVASGSLITLTLQSRDAAGNPLASGGLAVVFNRSGGTSTGTISATTDNTDGTYTATLTGLAAGTATTIGATINGSPITSSLPTVTVIPGSPSLSQSLISVAQANVASGSGVLVTLQVKDAFGNNLTAGGATVAFSRTGGTSTGSFGIVSDNGNGTYSATFTGAVSGTPTSINATIGGSAVTSAAPTVTVDPGPASLSQSLVTVSAGTVTSGNAVTLTLQAKDASGNNQISGGLSVGFSRSGGVSTGNISATTDNGNGTYTATFTGVTAGTATTINATIGGSPVTGVMPTVQVLVGTISIATSTVGVSSGTVASGGTVTLTLQAKDVNGNNLAAGGAAVLFGNTGGTSSGTIGATTDNTNGTYTATFTAVNAGTATTIDATIGGTPVSTAMPTITVTPGAVSTTVSTLAVSSGTVTSGAGVTLTVQAKDANGNNLTAGGLAVVFSHTGGTSTGSVTAATDNGNGTYTGTFTGIVAGTATTARASIGGVQISSALPTITVTPGAVSYAQSTIAVSASTVSSGGGVTVTVTAKDANANQLTAGTLTVALSRSGGTSTGTFGAVTDNGDGTYTATFTGVVSGTATTMTGTINGNPITSTLPQVTVNPGAISLAQSLVSTASGSVASGSNVLLTLAAKDANGNALTTGGETVLFTHSGGVSTGTISGTTDVGNGTYTATFTGALAGSATTIAASVGGSPVTSILPTLIVTVGPISPATSLLSVSGGTVASGSNVTLTLTGKDAAGNAIAAGGATVAFSRSGGTSTGSISSTTDNGNGTYTASFTGLIAGSATNIGATINAVPVSSGAPTVQVLPGPVSLSSSLISVAAGSVASGAGVTVTLTAKDGAGNQLSGGGLTVLFSHAGGTSTGTFSAVSDNTNGTYTATFTGVLAGSATTVNATIGGSAVTNTAPTMTVNPGAYSLAQSLVSVGSGTVTSGSSTTLSLQLKDAAGNSLTAGGETVVFSRTGGTSTGTISATSDAGNGTYTASFTGVAAGSATTINATVGGSAVTSVLPTIAVNVGPASLSQSLITLSAATLTSGSSINVTLQAKDVNGNAHTSGGSTVVFNRSGGTSTGNISGTTDNGDGTYSATFTGVLAGSATTIGATIGGSAVSSVLPTATVTPGAISTASSTVAVSNASVSSGSNVTLTLTAKDAAGNNLGAGGQTVVFAYSGGVSTGTVSGTTDVGNGTYTATFTGLTSGSATTINATIGGAAVTSTLPTVTVNPGSVSLVQSLVTRSSATVTSGANVTLTLTAKDANGNQLTGGGLTVVFSHTGGTSTGTVSGTTDNGNGTYNATFTGAVSGTPTTIAATIGGSAVTSTLPDVTVNPGAMSLAQTAVVVSAASIQSGATSTVTLTARDAAGNQLTTGGGTVTFSHSGGTSTGSISVVTDNNNGTYTATFSGLVAGTATTLAATYGGSNVTSTMPTVTVTPGALSLATSTVATSAATVNSGSNVTLTFRAKDANNNNITSGGETVVFTRTGGTSTGTISATTDVLNGTYTATFTGVTSGSATTINATVGGSAVTSTMPTVTVTPGSMSLAQSTVAVSAGTVASGSSVTVTVRAKDANGNNLTAGGLAVAVSHTGGTSTGTFGGVADNGDGTYTAQFTGIGAGTATTINATIGGSAVTSVMPTVAVNVGPVSLSQSTIAVSGSPATVASGATATVTLTARDANNNILTAGGLVVGMSIAGGTSTGSFSVVTDNTNGTYTSTFTAEASGTVVNVAATIGGSAVTSTQPSFTVVPGAASLANSLLTVGSATILSGNGTTLLLTAKDAYGNNLTAGGQTVVFSRSGGTSTGTISATTDNGNGTYSAAFTGLVAGSATTIGATIGGSAVTSILPTIAVNIGPASLAQSTVTLSAATLNSGTGVTITLQAKDVSGNNHTSGGLTVVFNRSGGTSTGNISGTTDNGDGTYSATFTGVLAGTATTVGATIGGSAVTSVLPTATVYPGTISTSVSTLTSSASSVLSGAAVTLTVTTKDAAGNNIGAGGEAVIFTYTGGTSTGSVSATTDVGNGTYTATFTGLASGTATTVNATIGGAAVTSTLPTVTVNPGAFSLSQSVVTRSAATITSGSTATLTLTAKDANGNQLTGGLLTVVFSHTGGTSTGTVSATTDNGNGTYNATFTGVVSGTSTTIGATIGGSAVTSVLPTLTVNPGAMSLAQTTVAVSAASIASGATSTITLTARDANSNQLTTGGGSVSFSHAGGASTGTIGVVTDNNNGTYTATFTGVVSGTATTVGATYGGSNVTSTMPTITVTPGALSLAVSTVTVSAGTVTSGNNVTLTFRAKDANNNNILVGGETVVFSRTGGTSTGTVSATTDNLNGTYTATFTGAVAGTATTINATVGGSPVVSAMPTVTVTPGAVSLAASTVSASAGSVASGSSITITVRAKDANGNNITTGGLAVLVSHSGGVSTGTFGGVADNGDGTYTSQFTGIVSGTPTTIGATIGGSAVTSVLPQVTVNVGPVSLSQSTIAVSGSPATLASGATATVTLTARDANNNILSAGGLTVLYALTGGTSTGTFSAVSDNSNGTYSSTFTAQAAGTGVSVAATIGGSAVTSSLPSFSVIPGAASLANSLVSVGQSTLTSGLSTTLTLTTKDAYGNDITSGGSTVVFSRSGGTSTGTISATTDNNNGTYTASFTGIVSGTATTISATINATPVSSVLPTIQVNVGSLSLAVSTLSVSSATVASGSVVTMTVQAKDANSNNITTGGQTVVFSHTGGTSVGTVSGTTDVGNGTYTATFTATTSGSPTTINATIGGSALTGTLPTIQVNPGPLSLTQSVVTVSSGTILSGGTSTLTLTIKDANGNVVGAGGQTVIFSRSGGTSTGTIGATTDNNNGTYTATFTGVVSGTATNIGATIGGSPVASAAPTITVSPGAMSLANSLVSVSSSTVGSGSNVTLTLTAKDANNNTLAGGGLTVVFNRTGGTSTGNIGLTTDNTNGTYTATFTAVASGTPTTIGATIGGSAVTTTLPTIQVDPGTVSVANAIIEVVGAPGSVASGATATLKVTAKDSNNNQHTSGGLTILFALSGGTSTGTISAVTDNNNGTYTATFTAQAAGTSIDIGATINAVAVTTAKPSFSVIPGPISLSASTVARGSATLASGATTTLTVTAKDTFGNLRSGHTIAFSQSGGTSTGTIGAVTDNTDGTYTATFTSVVSGTATTIGATIDGSPISSALPTITVNPGAISTALSLVTVSTATITSGNNVTLTLTSKDANGNLITGGGSTVAFTRSGGVSNGNISVTTDVGNGTYTATFASTTAGTATTIGATIGGSAVTSTLPTITVNPGAVSVANSVVQVAASSVAAGGTVNLTVIAKDANNNQLTGGGLTVAFTKGGGSSDGTINGLNDNGDGTYAGVFNATTIGTARTIGATIGGSAVTTTLPTISVTIGTLSLTNSTVGVSVGTIASGSPVTLTVIARDAFSNVFPTGGMTVALGHSGGTSTGTISAVTDNTNGSYTATFTGVVSGTATTINATINAQAVSSAAPTITVVPGPYSLAMSTVTVAHTTRVAGTATTLTLTARDAANNLVGLGGETVTFAKTGGISAGTISAVTDNSDGTYTASFSATTAGSPASIRGSINAAPLTSVQPTITVSPGAVDVSKCQITVNPNVIPLAGTSDVVLIAKDAFSNQLIGGGATVAFSFVGGQTEGTFSGTIDGSNGTYSSVFTGTVQGSATTIHATYNGVAITSTLPTIGVDPPEASPAYSTVSIASATVLSGSTVVVTLHARDSGDNVVMNGGESVTFELDTDGTSTGLVIDTPAIDVTDGTYTASIAGIVAGTAVTVVARINGIVVATTMPTLQVLPGPLAELVISSVPTTALVPHRMLPQVVVTLKDAQGNIRTGDTSTVTLSLAPGSAGGTLLGTPSMAAVAGVADFAGSDVGFDTVGTQILRATVGAITEDTGNITAIIPTLAIANGGDPLRVAYTAPSIAPAVVIQDIADSSTLAASTTAIAANAAGILAETTIPYMGVSPGSAIGFIDVANDVNQWTIDIDRNNQVSPDCDIVAPLDNATCTLTTAAPDTTFTLEYEDIRDATVSNSTLQITDSFISSNTLPVRKYSVTQVADLNPNDDAWVYPTNSVQADSDWTQGTTVAPMAVFNNKLYFVGFRAGTAQHQRLFSLSYSGATPVVSRVSNIRGNSTDVPTNLTVFDGKLFMTATPGNGDVKLMAMDTSENIYRMADINAAGASDGVGNLKEHGGKLFFTALAGAIQKLFMFDPAVGAGGTVYQKSDIRSGVTDNIHGGLTSFGGELYFGANTTVDNMSKLHKLNAAGTTITQISDTRNLATAGDAITSSIVFDNALYFVAQNGGNDQKLWKYTGSGNAVQMTNLRNGNTDSILNLTVFNNKLYFSAFNNLGDREMFALDAAGTLSRPFDLVPGNTDAIQNINTWDANNDGTDDYLIFGGAPISGSATKLFIMDTTGYVEQVSNIIPGGGRDNPGNGVSWNGDYYFRAHVNGADDVKLFRLRRH